MHCTETATPAAPAMKLSTLAFTACVAAATQRPPVAVPSTPMIAWEGSPQKEEGRHCGQAGETEQQGRLALSPIECNLLSCIPMLLNAHGCNKRMCRALHYMQCTHATFDGDTHSLESSRTSVPDVKQTTLAIEGHNQTLISPAKPCTDLI